MKRILTSLVLVASVYSFAQVSISAKNDHTPNATLDVEAMGSSTIADGILIPRVTTKMAQDMPQPETSTLVYIKEENIKTGGGARTVDVDVAGFYYFNGTKWVKLGGGEVNFSKATGNIRSTKVPIADTYFRTDDFLIIAEQGDAREIYLPNPGLNPDGRDFTGKIMSINNQAHSAISFKGVNAPLNMVKIAGGSGFLLMSNGTNWLVIGGLY